MQATIRECKEEIGIDVNPGDLTFAHLQHTVRRTERTYYNISFVVKFFTGTPSIAEPEKCNELVWCDIRNLPHDMIDSRNAVIYEHLKGNFYSEWIED